MPRMDQGLADWERELLTHDSNPSLSWAMDRLQEDNTTQTGATNPPTESRFERLAQMQREMGNEAFRYYHPRDNAWLSIERQIRMQPTAPATRVSRGQSTSGESNVYVTLTDAMGQFQQAMNLMNATFRFTSS